MSEDTKDSAAEADVRKIVKKEIAKQIGDVWAVLKRLKNAAEIHWGVDIDKDGKIGGRAPVWSLLAVLLVSVVIAMATSDIVVWYDSDATKGTAKITSDDAGTATLTVDAIAGNVTGTVTGDPTCDDINASGATSDTLGINLPASATAVLGTVRYVTATASNAMTDADYVKTDLLVGPNSANGATVYAYMKAIAADVTAATEDGSIALGIEVNSTATDMLTLSSSGAAIAGGLTFTGTPAVDVSMTIATNVNGGTNVVTCVMKDKSGATIAQKTMFRLWIADTDGGAVAAVAGDVVVSGGMELQQVVDKGDYWAVSDANGSCVFTITDTPAEETWVHAAVGGGAIRSVQSMYTAP